MSDKVNKNSSLRPEASDLLSPAQVTYNKPNTFLEIYKSHKTSKQNAIEELKKEVNKAITEARIIGAKNIVVANIEALTKTYQYIDQLESEGKLNGIALEMAYRELDELNNSLRENFQQYKNSFDNTEAVSFHIHNENFILPKDSSDLIRLSDVLCKIMKEMPVDTSVLPKYLQPTVCTFMSMSVSEKSEFITRINAAVVETNYRANRKMSKEASRILDKYEMKYLADKMEVERLRMLTNDITAKTIEKIDLLSQLRAT